mmetsp:Transcript_2788/g.8999  ORF Transcript_2788/g.8999 Transcript_2788/m.8999 type:complete len:209 (-) Transcript_2788:2701-3327(-)
MSGRRSRRGVRVPSTRRSFARPSQSWSLLSGATPASVACRRPLVDESRPACGSLPTWRMRGSVRRWSFVSLACGRHSLAIERMRTGCLRRRSCERCNVWPRCRRRNERPPKGRWRRPRLAESPRASLSMCCCCSSWLRRRWRMLSPRRRLPLRPSRVRATSGPASSARSWTVRASAQPTLSEQLSERTARRAAGRTLAGTMWTSRLLP